jgi:hypothetical protein
MDCIQAQMIISETIDDSPVDSAVLEMAKQHCRECPECAKYVRALNDVKRAKLPEPPADLADRIMAAVRAQAATLAEKSVEAEPGAETPPETGAAAAAGIESPAGPAVVTGGDPVDLVRSKVAAAIALARGLLSVDLGPVSSASRVWLTAGALVIVATGVIGFLGVRQILESGSTAATSVKTAETAPNLPQATPAAPAPAAPAPPAGTAALGSSATSTADASSETTGYVVFDGTVYRLTGIADIAAEQVPAVGTMNLAFASGAAPTKRTVRASDVVHRIYILDDANMLRTFDVVTRQYQGITYKERASDISALGTWPQLPASIPAPTSADGSPTFTTDSQTTSVAPTYHRLGQTAAQGIAVPPNTPEPDPANGNPNWTWWEPL